MGNKVSDEWAVPLCFTHHRALHTVGNEEAWWIEKGIDARAEALRLWRQSHGIREPVAASEASTADAAATRERQSGTVTPVAADNGPVDREARVATSGETPVSTATAANFAAE